MNYLNSLFIKAFLKLLNHGICGDNVGSENYGMSYTP